ncbi:MAG: DUF502 domain-containing protein [Rubrivivax sp.]
MPGTRLLRIFVTGLLAALPLAATAGVLWWATRLLVRWLGPQSPVGQLFVALGLGVAGSEALGYALGITLVAAMIFGLGLLVEAGLQRGLVRLVDAVVGRIPIVRSVYEMVQKVVGLFAQREGDGMKSMSAVWCHFGGVPTDGSPGRAAVLGLLSTPVPVLIGGRPYFGVIVPSAPVPVGGGLLYLPQDWVVPAGLGAEALTSIYVSMGMTSAQHLGGAAAVPARAPEPPPAPAPASSSPPRPRTPPAPP